MNAYLNKNKSHALLLQGYEWHAESSLYMPNNYLGKLQGDLQVTFDLDTAQAHFQDLTIDRAGHHYIIEVNIWTVPASTYDFNVQVETFDVMDRNAPDHGGKASRLTWRLLADYEEVVGGLEELFIANFLNNIGPLYPNVTMSDVEISSGKFYYNYI